MTHFSVEKLFKTDLLAIRICFSISLFLCIFYNAIVVFLSAENSPILAWWLDVDSATSDAMAAVIPAFHKIHYEMIENDCQGRYLLFQDVLSVNFIIVLLFFLLEMAFSIFSFYVSCGKIGQTIWKKIDERNKIMGREASVAKYRLISSLMFLIGNLLVFSGIIFIVPRPLYSEDYRMIFIIFPFTGVLTLNLIFVLNFLILPFWTRLGGEVDNVR